MVSFYRLSSAQENVDKDRRCCELLEKKSKRKFDLFKTDPVRAITSAHSIILVEPVGPFFWNQHDSH